MNMKKQIIELENLNSEALENLVYNTLVKFLPEMKKALQTEEEQLLNINETSLLLKRTRATIYSYIKKEIKPFDKPIRRGSSLYFKRSEILSYRETI